MFMRINLLLNQLKNQEIIKNEIAESFLVKELLSEHYPLLDQEKFNYAAYHALLPLTMLATQNEQTLSLKNEKIKLAQMHAAKLTILFGNDQEAIRYLKDYENRYANSQQLIHDACLFTLPEKGDYNIELWQSIILRQHPNSPNDLILRLLPFAKKIETYLHQHKNELVEQIKIRVTYDYELELSKKYDDMLVIQNKEEWVNQMLNKKRTEIERKVEYYFTSYLGQDINLSLKINLSSDEKLPLKERKKHLTAADQEYKKNLWQKIENDYRDKIKNSTMYATIDREKNNIQIINSPNKRKQEYIKLELAKETLNARIQNKVDNLLSSTTPLEEIKHYALHCMYQYSAKNPLAAQLFFEYGMTEENFNDYLSLQPQDNHYFIPDITIDGINISQNYASYVIKKLNPFDARAALLGKLTSCCQSLGQEGETTTIQGITDQRSGFYVLCEKIPGREEKILAQCLAWRDEDGNLIYDSVESQIDFREKNSLLIADFFTYLADELTKQHDIPSIKVGTGGNTPTILGVLEPIKLSYPLDYLGYSSDSRKQRLVAVKNLPLIEVYKDLNPNSQLKLDTPIVMNKKEIEAWCDLCLINNEEEYKKYVMASLAQIELPETFIDNRILLIRKWYDYLAMSELTIRGIRPYIKKGINVNVPYPKQKVALHIAINTDNLEVIQYLLQHGADINWKDSFGNAALYHAIGGVENVNMEVVSYLVEHQANINTKNINGDTPLHAATENGNRKVMKYLIKNQANINEKNNGGDTALNYAIYSRNLRAIKYLIKFQADINAKDKYGDSILHHAVFSNELNIVNYLIKKQADIHAKNNNGDTVLHRAVSSHRMDMVKCFVECGVDVNATNNKGNTVLHTYMANIFVDNFAMVNYLVEHGVDINAKNNLGDTALHMAIYANNIEMVKCLVEQQANLHTKNNKNKTPLQYAIEIDNQDMIAYLKKAETDQKKPTSALQVYSLISKKIDPKKISDFHHRCLEMITRLNEIQANQPHSSTLFNVNHPENIEQLNKLADLNKKLIRLSEKIEAINKGKALELPDDSLENNNIVRKINDELTQLHEELNALINLDTKTINRHPS